MTLNELKVGQAAKISALKTSGEMRERLRALQLGEGANVRLIRISLGRGNFLVETVGRVCVRREIAEKIEVKAL